MKMPMTGEAKIIMIVEDDEVYRRSIARVLKELGYQVMLAGSAEEALEKFDSRNASLIMTDYMLPGMDGLALARHIRQRSGEVPVILLSGTYKPDIEKAVKEGNIDAVLSKPVDLGTLETTIAAHLIEAEG
jgi:CheY-like chemotaxis protein